MAQMRMAQLARSSGLSVATIKYYVREGLLHPGRRTGVNQAVYDQSHLERLALIRALAGTAGLPLTKIREVVAAVNADTSVLEAMGLTQDALVGEGEAGSPQDPEAAAELAGLIESRGWHCQPGSPAYQAAVRAIAELRAEELTAILERLDEYANLADTIGRTDVATVSEADSLAGMIRGVVLGTVLRRPMLDALILLAQQHYAHELSAERRLEPGRVSE